MNDKYNLDFSKLYIAKFRCLVLPAYECQLNLRASRKFYSFSSNVILNCFDDYLKFNVRSMMLEQT